MEMGVFREHEEPKGDEQLCYMKNKVMGKNFPALRKKHDHNERNNVNPLPSFVIAKNTHDSCISMLKESSHVEKETEVKNAKLLAHVKLSKSSVGIGLEDVRMLKIHMPPNCCSY